MNGRLQRPLEFNPEVRLDHLFSNKYAPAADHGKRLGVLTCPVAGLMRVNIGTIPVIWYFARLKKVDKSAKGRVLMMLKVVLPALPIIAP